MSKQKIEEFFPKLFEVGYSITSPETPNYNCIAWSAGDNESWWWPDSQEIYYWPPEVERKETIDAFIKVYEILGYEVCKDGELEEGFDKIAIYINEKDKPTHAARQLNSGAWTSKLGISEDITHFTLDDLMGSIYGSVAVFMKRLKNHSSSTS